MNMKLKLLVFLMLFLFLMLLFLILIGFVSGSLGQLGTGLAKLLRYALNRNMCMAA